MTGAGGSVPSMAICVLQGPVASMSQVLSLPPSILRKNSHWLTLLSCSMAQFCPLSTFLCGEKLLLLCSPVSIW